MTRVFGSAPLDVGTEPEEPTTERAVDAMSMLLLQEIERWRCDTPRTEADGVRLARIVTDETRRRALDTRLLSALDVLADRHRGRDPRLDAFLAALLSRTTRYAERTRAA